MRSCHLVLMNKRKCDDDDGLTPNLRWGTAHASVPPIFKEGVLSDARESMNRVKKVFLLSGKGNSLYTTVNIVKIRKIWEKKGKIRKTRSMTKKRSFRNLGPRKK